MCALGLIAQVQLLSPVRREFRRQNAMLGRNWRAIQVILSQLGWESILCRAL